MQCEFVQVTTRDGLDLQGLVFVPKGDPSTLRRSADRSGQTPTPVGVWIHGLGSNFHRGYKRMTTLARIFNENGIAFATFDTRGRDWVAHAVKPDKRKKKGYRRITIGAGYEKFIESQYDLDAIVDYLRELFPDVILLGHSTGANKAVYYLSKPGTQKKVKGVVLVSPVSDVPMLKKELGEHYNEALEVAQRMIREDRGWEIVPRELSRTIYTAQRLLSLATQESSEQMFPHKQFHGPLRLFSRIKIPTLIIFGSLDDYLLTDKVTTQELLRVFTRYHKSKSFKTIVIPESDHSFIDKEEELAKFITNWMKENI